MESLNTNRQALLGQVLQYAMDYQDQIAQQPAFPAEDAIQALSQFDEAMPNDSADPSLVIELLNRVGASATTAQNGGRFYGFVNGGVLPVAHAAEWISDTWNQNAALYVSSPIASKLEALCETWLTDLFGLPDDTALGLVTGSSNALICALAAARNELLRRQDYDLAQQGLRNSPKIRVVLSEDAHSTVKAALSVLGIGMADMEFVPVDALGRMIPEAVPVLDDRTMLLVQAGNVNGGAFDPIDELCDLARKAGAWVHVDGAFGLWAAASGRLRHLTKGMEKADSWSCDAHKTLNAGYDCGIVLCRHRTALVSALQAGGAYLQFSVKRDNMLYTADMSRRARGIVLWAVLKQLGKSGVEQLINDLCDHAVYFSEALKNAGFDLVNPPCFNQFMIRCDTEAQTRAVLKAVQESGVCWCGGSSWKGKAVIRLSVCSHATTREDLDMSVQAFREALKKSTI